LVVDDKQENLLIMNEILSSEYEVITAMNGAEALKIAEKKIPDLILLDVSMPVMDGYETCEHLKSNDRTANIPVIFVTSMSENLNEEKGLQLGAIDYIAKPVRPAILRARIQNHLQLKRHRDNLYKESTIDSLTELSNRRKFDEVMKKEWDRALKNKDSIAFILIDVDHFKPYNDTYGHIEGDTCLKKIAAELTSCVKECGGFLARYGGEEFIIFLYGNTLAQGFAVSEKVKKAIQDLNIPHKLSSAASCVTVSIGVSALIPNEENVPETLIHIADESLYEAKRKGRNKIVALQMNQCV